MNGRLALRALFAVIVIAAPGWLGLKECRAGSIQDLLDDKTAKGMITVGNLTFAFTDKSVDSDPAGNPTAAQIDLNPVKGGLMFSFNPLLSLTTPDALNQYVFISYTVTATRGIYVAGLSFTGTAVDINTKSEVTETFPGRNEMNYVYTMKDSKGKVTGQNDQSVQFADEPLTLSVKDTGHLSTGVRGNGEKSTAQLYDITNTFSTVPEPASIVSGSIAALLGLGVWFWRGRYRAA